MVAKIRVMIVDDHPLLLEALNKALSRQRDMEVVAEATDGIEAITLASELLPDIVIMDVVMPKLNGIEASKRIKQTAPSTAILILTAYDDDNYVLGLLEAGASGYLLKSARGNDIVGAVRSIRAGESVLHPNIIEKLLKRAIDKTPVTEGLGGDHSLSVRERELLKLLATGMSNQQIADTLCLSLRTVKAHVSNIFAKMNVASRSEALVEALRIGIITLEDTEQQKEASSVD